MRILMLMLAVGLIMLPYLHPLFTVCFHLEILAISFKPMKQVSKADYSFWEHPVRPVALETP